MAAATREQAHEQLTKLYNALTKEHRAADQARLVQLAGHTETIHMVIDQLYDDAEKRP